MTRWLPKRFTVPVPFLGAEATWEPTDAEAKAAWELLVELVTRTTIVEMSDDEGSDREALASLRSLFSTSRALLRAHGPETARDRDEGRLSLAVVVVRMLNDVLRPFLSRWHPRLEEHEAARPSGVGVATHERTWGGPTGPLHHAFRSDLRSVREALREYIYVLGLAAQASDFASTVFRDVNEPTRVTKRVYATVATQRPMRLGRVRRRMTRWFDPIQLVATVYRAARQTNDTRDSGPAETDVHDCSSATDLWFDYVADMGDAFDPTAQVAWMVGRRDLLVGSSPSASHPLPRGSLLVLGGDEVYPYATRRRYAKQLEKPYRHALENGGGDAPWVFAIPGNHDWYGGLGHWREFFTAGDGGGSKSFAGWQVRQKASWWTIKLPHGWWMWGLDTYTDGTVNSHQRDYFKAKAELLQPGDQVILCTPVPLWRLRESKPHQLVVIDELVRELIDPTGARASVFLAGDSHVFARYTREASSSGTVEHHITSGGGGAFLHPTHNLAPAVPQTSVVDDAAFVDPAPFVGGRFWPDQHRSRAGVVRGALRAVYDRQSLTLGLLVALLYTGYALVAGADLRGSAPEGGWAGLRHALQSSVHWPVALLVTALTAVLLVGAGVGMAHANTRERAVVRFARRAGVVHGVVQLVVLFITLVLSHWLVGVLSDGWPPALVLAALSGAAGAVGTTFVLLAYLSVVNRNHRVNDNEAFSMRHYEDGKHFLRCHIDTLGHLTVHLIGMDGIRRGWSRAIEAGAPLPPRAAAGSSAPMGAVEWTETVRPQIDPIAFGDGENRWVALSISDPDDADPAQVAQLHDLVREVAEALLAAGCNVAYGGDDRPGGYDRTLAEAASRSADGWVPRVRRYLATSLPADHQSARTPSHVELVPLEGCADSAPPHTRLAAMRLLVSETTIARVVFGGRTEGRGTPGVLHEAVISLRRGQPLLVVGGSGGAARLIAAAIAGEPLPSAPARATRSLLDALLLAAGSPADLRNGLTANENAELLVTGEPRRIVQLVLAGVESVARPETRR